MNFEFSTGGRAAPRREGQPMRILAIADLGAGQRGEFAARAPRQVDAGALDAFMARIAPRLEIQLPGENPSAVPQRLTFDFAAMEDFHPDRLYRHEAFATLRLLRSELAVPGGTARVAAALELPLPAAPNRGGESDDEAIARLLGRAPDGTPAAGAAQDIVARLAREFTAVQASAAPDAAAPGLAKALDARFAARMSAILHHPDFQALEATWRGLEKLATGLELGEELQLFVLDATRRELQSDVMDHAADLSRSHLCELLCGEATRPPEGTPWTLILCDLEFGAGLDDVLLLAGLGALGAAAAAPLLAGAVPILAGCPAVKDLAAPEQWGEPAAEDAARWGKLRQSASAPWIGLALPRVLARLPYGARREPVEALKYEEIEESPPPEELLWMNPAWILALLAGEAFQSAGWPPDLDEHRDVADLPSLSFRDAAGDTQLQPCAEALLGETAAARLLAAGLMPLLASRRLNSLRLPRWQSIADPPTRLGQF